MLRFSWLLLLASTSAHNLTSVSDKPQVFFLGDSSCKPTLGGSEAVHGDSQLSVQHGDSQLSVRTVTKGRLIFSTMAVVNGPKELGHKQFTLKEFSGLRTDFEEWIFPAESYLP